MTALAWPAPQQLRPVVGAVAALCALSPPVLSWLGVPLVPASTLTVAAPMILGVAGIWGLPALALLARPLPAGLDPRDAARRTSAAQVTVTLARLGAATLPVLVGFAGTLARESLNPVLVGAAATVALQLVFVYPRRAVLAPLRQRLESAAAS